MADIDIQRKERSPWGWIVGLIALVCLVIAVVWIGGGEDTETVADMDVIGTPPAGELGAPVPSEAGGFGAASSEVDAYLTASDQFATADMGRQHEATGSALDELANALAALVPDSETMRAGVDELHMAAERIRQTAWSADTHSDQVRSAAMRAASLIEEAGTRASAQAGDAVDTAVRQVREAADAIAADEPLLEQRSSIQNFFSAAGQALRQLTGTAAAGSGG